MTKVVFQNLNGEVLRFFPWTGGGKATLVRRNDTKRMELYEDLQVLKDKNISYNVLKEVDYSLLQSKPVSVGNLGQLCCVSRVENCVSSIQVKEEPSLDRPVFLSVLLMAVMALAALLAVPKETKETEEELKKYVTQVIKRTVRPPVNTQIEHKIAKPKPLTKKQKITKSIKRMGALAALGRLNKNLKQQAGLNLGAVKTSRGPGLGGGTQGSGGIQTSIYGRGLMAAPVGPGQNLKGAGGYGTKGKGGGKAGYGQMKLIGSAGGSLIPLAQDAKVGGGLDKGLISSVIQKYMGQIRFCYEQGLQTNPKLTGRVAINFVISGKNGGVSTASIAHTTLHSKGVEDCILSRMKSWMFPLPEGGVNVRVSYPFVLRRVGSS